METTAHLVGAGQIRPFPLHLLVDPVPTVSNVRQELFNLLVKDFKTPNLPALLKVLRASVSGARRRGKNHSLPSIISLHLF